MARPLRIEYPGAFYHVMNRGAGKKSIFPDPVGDRALFIQTLSDSCDLWKIRIHAYSLMPNHYHLLMETPLPNLSRAMRHVDGVFTQRFNRVHGTDGPLFRGRFKSILIEKESYFLELLRYIHLNSVRALLYSSPEADPFCSHRGYIFPSGNSRWLTTQLGLSFFGQNEVEARKAFDHFVKAGITPDMAKVLDGKRWPAILGTEQFVENIQSQFRLAEPPHEEKPQERALVYPELKDPESVIIGMANLWGLEREALTNKSGNKPSLARKSTMYFLRRFCQLPYNEIGSLMGGLKDSAVESAIRIVERKFEKELTALEKKLDL